MGERRHEQCAFTCPARTEGKWTSIWHIKHSHVPSTPPVLSVLLGFNPLKLVAFALIAVWFSGVLVLSNLVFLSPSPLQMTERDGQHIWRMKHFNKPTYCSVCQNMLLGLGKQGLCCTCKSSAPPPGGRHAPHTLHKWWGVVTHCAICYRIIIPNLPSSCPSGCKYTVHSRCANKNPEPCSRTFVKSKNEIGVRTHTNTLWTCPYIGFVVVF